MKWSDTQESHQRTTWIMSVGEHWGIFGFNSSSISSWNVRTKKPSEAMRPIYEAAERRRGRGCKRLRYLWCRAYQIEVNNHLQMLVKIRGQGGPHKYIRFRDLNKTCRKPPHCLHGDLLNRTLHSSLPYCLYIVGHWKNVHSRRDRLWNRKVSIFAKRQSLGDKFYAASRKRYRRLWHIRGHRIKYHHGIDHIRYIVFLKDVSLLFGIWSFN